MWSVLHHLCTKWQVAMDAHGLRWGITLLPGPDSARRADVFCSEDPTGAQATKVPCFGLFRLCVLFFCLFLQAFGRTRRARGPPRSHFVLCGCVCGCGL